MREIFVMRGFLYWLIFLPPAVLNAVFGIFLFSLCSWMVGVLFGRFILVFAFGFVMPAIMPFLFPLGWWSAFLMVIWFSAASFYICYLWDMQEEKG